MAVVRVEGVREFKAAMKRLGASLDDMRTVFSEAAALGARTAAAYAPKRTGALASDIRGGNSSKNAVVRAGRTTVPYAGPINYGWPDRGIAGSFFMQKVDTVWQPFTLQRIKTEIDQKIRTEGLE